MRLLFISLFSCISFVTVAQNVGIGTNTPAASAMLHVNSTDKGLLIPRLTTAQRTAIANPATGLQVYDTNTNSFWYYNASAWVQIGAGSGGGTNFWTAGNNGTINNSNTGNVGINNQYPLAKLDVNGDAAFDGAPVTYQYSEQGGYYYADGALRITSPVSGFESKVLIMDGNKVQSYTTDTDDPSLDDYASELLLNPLGGNVAVGTNSPVATSKMTLQTDDNYSTALVIKNPSGSARFDAYVGGPANANVISFGTQTNSPLAFFTNSANRLFISANGNVGIGVDNPTFSKLEVRVAAEQVGWAVGTTGYNMHTFFGGANRSLNSEGCYLGTSGVVTGGNPVPLHFFTNGQWSQMTLLPNGNVGIGTTNPTYKLSVNGNIRSKEVVVETSWADYVFEDDYKLLSLPETEQYIAANKHLPGIPSAADIQTNGLCVGALQTKMMSKIEELTLHIIRQEKMITALQEQLLIKK